MKQWRSEITFTFNLTILTYVFNMNCGNVWTSDFTYFIFQNLSTIKSNFKDTFASLMFAEVIGEEQETLCTCKTNNGNRSRIFKHTCACNHIHTIDGIMQAYVRMSECFCCAFSWYHNIIILPHLETKYVFRQKPMFKREGCERGEEEEKAPEREVKYKSWSESGIDNSGGRWTVLWN